MRYYVMLSLLVVACLTACGEEEGAPQAPPIEEWCDLDRPREDCFVDGLFQIQTYRDFAPLCETRCNRIATVFVGTKDMEDLRAMTGFREINYLRISGSTLRSLQGLETLERARGIELEDASVDSLEGLSGLKRVEEEFKITNTAVTSLEGLDSLEFVGRSFTVSGRSLTSLRGVENLTSANGIGIIGTGVETLDGFSGLESLDYGLAIWDNYGLRKIEGFERLRSVPRLGIENNPNLSGCEIDAFVEGLEISVSQEISGNGPSCD